MARGRTFDTSGPRERRLRPVAGRNAREERAATRTKAERRYRQPLCAGIHIAAPFAALELGDSAWRTPRREPC